MAQDLWQLAQARRDDHVFSTLFPAQSVQEQLNTDAGIDDAIEWCRQTAVTRVYVESFRSGLEADEANLVRARDRFRQAGLDVSGCITTTDLERQPGAPRQFFPCLTYPPAQQQLQRLFEFAARLFDEIMIDDFFCTACECDDCTAARGERSWADYRLQLMNHLSAARVLGPAHAVNPRVSVIIKYPQWYEEFHERGYDVDRQTRLFDKIWVGTEARDIDDQRWGGCATYRPFWLMRWLGQIGGPKCGGGWYDPYGTHEHTYLEQARQTLLGGARESVLFCYPSLLENTGPANVEALRAELPALFDLARWVKGERPRGIVSYRPPNAPARGDDYIFDWLGMVGLPVIPSHTFPADARAALFSAHALADANFPERARDLASGGARILLTSAAAQAVRLPQAYEFEPPRPARDLMSSPRLIQQLRQQALAPFGLSLDAPAGVALYLLGDHKIALENFAARPADVRLGLGRPSRCRAVLTLGAGEAAATSAGDALAVRLPARSLVAIDEEPA